MLRNQHQSSKTGVRAAVAFALLAVVGLGWTTSAQAQTQCSGSIILQPTKGQDPPADVLEQSEALVIGVGIRNTTTVSGVDADANVRGTTTIVLSCATEFPCVSELAALTFDSCLATMGVASCDVDPMNPNQVLITYDGNSFPLPADETHHRGPPRRTRDARPAHLNPTSGQFFVVADTGSGNIFNANCAGSGQGSAPLFYPGICGDGFADPELGEQCDDGNDIPFDGCGTPEGNCLLCPDSTPCPDTDNNECTDAGCNASGVCDQLHTLPNSEPCADTGNECAAAGCNGAGVCDQHHTPAQDSTPCTDDDGNICTEAGCAAGVCNQNHVLPNSKPCDGHRQRVRGRRLRRRRSLRSAPHPGPGQHAVCGHRQQPLHRSGLRGAASATRTTSCRTASRARIPATNVRPPAATAPASAISSTSRPRTAPRART